MSNFKTEQIGRVAVRGGNQTKGFAPVLWNASSLIGYNVSANDGEIGTVSDLLFDDEKWTIRWLVIDTGTWLSSGKVLLPPAASVEPIAATRELKIGVTRQQVKDSPSIETDAPVSRVHESDIYEYYGWEPYWLGYPYAAAAGMPNPIPPERHSPQPDTTGAGAPGAARRGDPHLRSMNEVTGYYIHASDGDIGHVEDFLVDAETWTVRYLVVDTRNWWPGKKTLAAPQSFTAVNWNDGTVTTNLTQDGIRNAPEYDPTQTVDRAYEERYHDYYGYPAYWV